MSNQSNIAFRWIGQGKRPARVSLCFTPDAL
jgi:hypothetical protein